MCLEALDLTRGLTTHHCWGNFKIDEKGAADLLRKKLPNDLSEFIQKVVRTLKDRCTAGEEQFQAMAALRCVFIQPEHLTVPYGHRA